MYLIKNIFMFALILLYMKYNEFCIILLFSVGTQQVRRDSSVLQPHITGGLMVRNLEICCQNIQSAL